MNAKLENPARAEALATLESAGWTHEPERDAIVKTFVFADFADAFGWMTRVAIWAEKWDHHPEWDNVYKTVNVLLTTHDVDGLSPLDVKLAEKMDALAGSGA